MRPEMEDIHFDTGTMHIGKTLQRIRTFQDNGEETGGSHATGTKITITSPKSSHSDREIPIPDFLLELLQRKRNQKGYLISGKKKEYTEPRTLQYRFQRILKTLGIPYFNFHMLRHIFATNCISHGFDMKTLSELLGHSKCGHHYAHLCPFGYGTEKNADGRLSDDGLTREGYIFVPFHF